MNSSQLLDETDDNVKNYACQPAKMQPYTQGLSVVFLFSGYCTDVYTVPLMSLSPVAKLQCRVFIKHQRSENSPFTTQKSLFNFP